MFIIAVLMYCEWIGAATLAFSLFIIAAVGDWLDASNYVWKINGCTHR